LLAAVNDNLAGDLKEQIIATNEFVGPTLDLISDANANKPKKYQPSTSRTPLKSAMKKPSPKKDLKDSVKDSEEEELTKPNLASRSDTLDNLLQEVNAKPADSIEDLDKLVDEIDDMLAIDDKPTRKLHSQSQKKSPKKK
jgi:hypothetical protein